MSNTQPYTVMTVCTGNICRSPMGEIILRHFFNERGLGDQVNVESSGVSDEEWSHPIDPRAVRVLRERGYGDEIPRDHFAHRISRAGNYDCARREHVTAITRLTVDEHGSFTTTGGFRFWWWGDYRRRPRFFR